MKKIPYFRVLFSKKHDSLVKKHLSSRFPPLEQNLVVEDVGSLSAFQRIRAFLTYEDPENLSDENILRTLILSQKYSLPPLTHEVVNLIAANKVSFINFLSTTDLIQHLSEKNLCLILKVTEIIKGFITPQLLKQIIFWSVMRNRVSIDEVLSFVHLERFTYSMLYDLYDSQILSKHKFTNRSLLSFESGSHLGNLIELEGNEGVLSFSSSKQNVFFEVFFLKDKSNPSLKAGIDSYATHLERFLDWEGEIDSCCIHLKTLDTDAKSFTGLNFRFAFSYSNGKYEFDLHQNKSIVNSKVISNSSDSRCDIYALFPFQYVKNVETKDYIVVADEVDDDSTQGSHSFATYDSDYS
eukprot:snap_masked-scaffold_32-processed-gene-1.9-mRNA-1 protein AED:1.00 eAED:1.00 QI:0/-1/0/0/-1/1/1/0/352